jgi:hypothetical protein
MSYKLEVKALPLQMVVIEPLSCNGRVVSIRIVAGNIWYSVDYFADGQLRNAELHKDDIELLKL